MLFRPHQKKVNGPKLQKWAKYWLKTSFGWYLHFMTGKEISKSLLCQKITFDLQNKSEKCKCWVIIFLVIFWSFFGPFLELWSDDLFWQGQKTKSDFFGQKNHFWFYEQPYLTTRNIGCSNTSNTFLGILLLRPNVGDFKTWIFWTFWGSPIMPQWSFS